MKYENALKKFVNHHCWPVHYNSLIFLSGHSGSGKNTLADRLAYHLPNVLVVEYAFADTLKRTASLLTGIPYCSFFSKKEQLVSSEKEITEIKPDRFVDGYGREQVFKAPSEVKPIKIGKDWTIRDILLELGATNDYYPKELWAKNVVQQIRNKLHNYRMSFGSETPMVFHVITDLRYPRELFEVKKELPDWPSIVINLDTGKRSAIKHESEQLVDNPFEWSFTTRENIDARPLHEWEYDNLDPDLMNSLNEEIVLLDTLNILFTRKFLTRIQPEE